MTVIGAGRQISSVNGWAGQEREPFAARNPVNAMRSTAAHNWPGCAGTAGTAGPAGTVSAGA